jgi:hypothetical protein
MVHFPPLPWYGQAGFTPRQIPRFRAFYDSITIEAARERFLFLAKVERGVQQADAGKPFRMVRPGKG